MAAIKELLSTGREVINTVQRRLHLLDQDKFDTLQKCKQFEDDSNHLWEDIKICKKCHPYSNTAMYSGDNSAEDLVPNGDYCETHLGTL